VNWNKRLTQNSPNVSFNLYVLLYVVRLYSVPFCLSNSCHERRIHSIQTSVKRLIHLCICRTHTHTHTQTSNSVIRINVMWPKASTSA